MVDRTSKHQIIDWRPVNQRICVIRIKGKFRNISLINVQAPTEEKDIFYDALERVLDNCPRNDMKIVTGDLNAKIRREEFHLRQTGKHSLHDESNENDFRVINFVASKNGGGQHHVPKKEHS